jgi:hypothetical protein
VEREIINNNIEDDYDANINYDGFDGDNINNQENREEDKDKWVLSQKDIDNNNNANQDDYNLNQDFSLDNNPDFLYLSRIDRLVNSNKNNDKDNISSSSSSLFPPDDPFYSFYEKHVVYCY